MLERLEQKIDEIIDARMCEEIGVYYIEEGSNERKFLKIDNQPLTLGELKEWVESLRKSGIQSKRQKQSTITSKFAGKLDVSFQ